MKTLLLVPIVSSLLLVACLSDGDTSRFIERPSNNVSELAPVQDLRLSQIIKDWYIQSYSPVTHKIDANTGYMRLSANGSYVENLLGIEETGKWKLSDDGLLLQLFSDNGQVYRLTIKKLSNNRLVIFREQQQLEVVYIPAMG